MLPLTDFGPLMSELLELDGVVKKQRSAGTGARS
jgi:hypothetical protein